MSDQRAWDADGDERLRLRADPLRWSPMEFTRITTSPHQMGGIACLRGLRIPVATVVSLVAEGQTTEEISHSIRTSKPKTSAKRCSSQPRPFENVVCRWRVTESACIRSYDAAAASARLRSSQLTRMCNLAACDGSNRRRLHGGHSGRLTVERHELDLEGLAVGVNVNHRPDVANFQARVGHRCGQYHPIVFLNHAEGLLLARIRGHEPRSFRDPDR
jgi:hypothetical protein